MQMHKEVMKLGCSSEANQDCDHAATIPEKAGKVPNRNEWGSKSKFKGTLDAVDSSYDGLGKYRMGTSNYEDDHDGVSQSAANGSEGFLHHGKDTKRDFAVVEKQHIDPSPKVSGSGFAVTKEEHGFWKGSMKQPVKESAKRPCLCKELKALVAKLKELEAENSRLCNELRHLSEECLQLQIENQSIKEELADLVNVGSDTSELTSLDTSNDLKSQDCTSES